MNDVMHDVISQDVIPRINYSNTSTYYFKDSVRFREGKLMF